MQKFFKFIEFEISKKNNLFFLLILLFIPHILNGFIKVSDWDLYNNLYYGSRLLEGELLWTTEFHDKFPVIQYLFGIPAFFKSLFVWKLLSFSFQLVSSLLFFKSTNILLKDWGKDNKYTILISKYISLIYFVLPFFLSGFTHFSNFSSNLISISISLYVIKNKIYKSKKFFRILVSFLSFLSLSIAISIRPYYLLISIFMGLWIPIRSSKLNKNLSKNNFIFKYFIKWNFLLFTFTFLINFLPYFLTNNSHFIFDGIVLNAQNIVPQSIYANFLTQFKTLLIYNVKFLIIYLIFIKKSIFKKFKKINFFKLKKKPSLFFIDSIFLGLFSPLLLEIIIISKHYHNHYSLMFTTFIAYLAFSLVIVFSKDFINKKYSNTMTLKKSKSILFLLIILVFESVNGASSLIKNINLERKSVNTFSNKILNYSKANFNEISFIDFTSQRFHLYLNHSRNGFPHPAHVGHLENDWYLNNKIFVPERLRSKFPLSINELFKITLESDQKLIIVNKEYCKSGNLGRFLGGFTERLNWKISSGLAEKRCNKTSLYKLLNESIYFKKNKKLTNSLNQDFYRNGVVFERI